MLEYRQKNFSNPSKLAVKKSNYKAFVYNANAKIRMPDQYVAMSIADYFMVILSILGVQKSYAIEKGCFPPCCTYKFVSNLFQS